MRNPRRTAATASALMIGLGLVVFVAVFGASAKASTTAVLERTLKADFILISPTLTGFSTSAAEDARAVPGVDTVSQVRQAEAKIEGGTAFLTGLDPGTFPVVSEVDAVQGGLEDLANPNSIAVFDGRLGRTTGPSGTRSPWSSRPPARRGSRWSRSTRRTA